MKWSDPGISGGIVRALAIKRGKGPGLILTKLSQHANLYHDHNLVDRPNIASCMYEVHSVVHPIDYDLRQAMRSAVSREYIRRRNPVILELDPHHEVLVVRLLCS